MNIQDQDIYRNSEHSSFGKCAFSPRISSSTLNLGFRNLKLLEIKLRYITIKVESFNEVRTADQERTKKNQLITMQKKINLIIKLINKQISGESKLVS